MNKLPNILLVIALVAFVVGFVEGSRPGGWGLGVPLGAVVLGLFFLTKILQKESARFDEERYQREKMAGRNAGETTDPNVK